MSSIHTKTALRNHWLHHLDSPPGNWCGTKHYAPDPNALGVQPVQNTLNYTAGVIIGAGGIL